MKPLHLMRYVTAGLAALSIFLTVAVPASAQVEVTVDGSQVDFSPAPIIQSGRVFVPLRGVFERLGASVVYNNGTINATGNGNNIQLQIGSTQATINGQPQTVDVAPFIVGASTYVPLRFVSTALGASVNWDNTNRIVAISTNGQSTQASYQQAPSENYAYQPPPPLPVYEQPPLQEPNEIWQPGYWASGPYGYFWVPGTWVQPPQPGYLWTPGYWQASNNGFGFIHGFWGLVVGFYGGVHYGGGYDGQGYSGGQWNGNQFRYNTAVSRVDTTVIKNVYINKTVINNYNTTNNNTSYVGGANGLQARPTAEQIALAKQTHPGLTPVQIAHVKTAAQDRALLASVNHNTPPVLAVAHPLSETNRPDGFVPVAKTDLVKPEKAVAPIEHEPAMKTEPSTTKTEEPAMKAEPKPDSMKTEEPAMKTEPPAMKTEEPAMKAEPKPDSMKTEEPAMKTAEPEMKKTPEPMIRETERPVVHTPMPEMRTAAPVIKPRPLVRHTPVPTHPPVKKLEKPVVHETPHHEPTEAPK